MIENMDKIAGVIWLGFLSTIGLCGTAVVITFTIKQVIRIWKRY